MRYRQPDLEDYADWMMNLPKIFHVTSINPGHICYHDPENRLKIYLQSNFVEVTSYLSYEIMPDKGVFVLVVGEISNFGIIHGRRVEITFEVAGFNDVAANSEKDAIEFMIAKVMERVLEYQDEHRDIPAIEKSLREALLRQ